MSNAIRKATGAVQEKVGKVLNNDRMQAEGETKKREAERTSAHKHTDQHATGQHTAGQHTTGQHTAGTHPTGQHHTGQKAQGHVDQTLGGAKEKIGAATGSHGLEAKGAAQKVEGAHEKGAGEGHHYQTGTAAGAGTGPLGAGGIHPTGGHDYKHDAHGHPSNLAGEAHHGTANRKDAHGTGNLGQEHAGGGGYSAFGAQSKQYGAEQGLPGAHAQGQHTGTTDQHTGQHAGTTGQHTGQHAGTTGVAGQIGGEHGGQYATGTHPQDHKGLTGTHPQEHGQYTSAVHDKQDLNRRQNLAGGVHADTPRPHDVDTGAHHQQQSSFDPTKVAHPKEADDAMRIPGAYQDDNQCTNKNPATRDVL